MFVRAMVISVSLFLGGLATAQNTSVFDYDSNHRARVSVDSKQSKKRFDLFHGHLRANDPLTEEVIHYPFHFYRLKRNRPAPLIIITPPISGVSVMDRSFAKMFVKKGFHVVIAEAYTDISNPETPVSELSPVLARLVVGIRRIVDFAEDQPEINSEQIGLFGVSLGGIRGIMAHSVDTRIGPTIILMAGGDFPSMLLECDNKYCNGYKNARFAAGDFENPDTMEDEFAKWLRFDSLDFASLARTEEIFMYISGRDREVPTDNQWKLWEALGRPDHSFHKKLGHKKMGAVVFLFRRGEVVRFYKSQWQIHTR